MSFEIEINIGTTVEEIGGQRIGSTTVNIVGTAYDLAKAMNVAMQTNSTFGMAVLLAAGMWKDGENVKIDEIYK